MKGWVCSRPERAEHSSYFEICPIQAFQKGRTLEIEGRVSTYLPVSESWGGESPVAFGDILQVRAHFRSPTRYLVPGAKDPQLARKAGGLGPILSLKSPLQLEVRGRHHWAVLLGPLLRYTDSFEQAIRRSVSAPNQQLLRALFLGKTRGLDPTLFEYLRSKGLVHLFVVSGFHVSLIGLAACFLFGRLGRAGPWLSLSLIWIYLFLTGGEIPGLRAGLTWTFFFLLRGLGVLPDLANAVGLSALCLLFLWPDAIFGSSFQLSFLSLLAIVVLVLPALERIRSVARGLRSAFGEEMDVRRDTVARQARRWRFAAEEFLQFFGPGIKRLMAPCIVGAQIPLALFCASVLIQSAIFPVLLYHTNLFAWAQPVWAVFLTPVAMLALATALLTFLLYWTPFGPVLFVLISWLSNLLMHGVRVDELNYWSLLAQPSKATLLGYCLIWVELLLTGRRVTCGLLPLGLVVLQSISICDPPQSRELAVTMLDVGQGESLHFRYPDGSHALLDSGGSRSVRKGLDPIGLQVVARYLWSQGVGRLDDLLLTHSDQDHVGGAPAILKAFPGGNLFASQPMDGIETPPARLLEGDRWERGGVLHQVLYPGPEVSAGPLESKNNRSLVLALEYGNFRLLVTGDIEVEAERVLLEKCSPVSVLKVAHHGARGSSSLPFLKRVQAKVALISAGRTNPFGHPADETLKRLNSVGTQIYSTAKEGSLRLTTDGRLLKLYRYDPFQERFGPLGEMRLTED